MVRIFHKSAKIIFCFFIVRQAQQKTNTRKKTAYQVIHRPIFMLVVCRKGQPLFPLKVDLSCCKCFYYLSTMREVPMPPPMQRVARP